MSEQHHALLWQYVEKWATLRPDAEAIVFGDDRITWRAFHHRVESTAKLLLELGVNKGDRVAMLGMARPEFLITFMAASKVGAMWMGLSPKSALREMDYLVGHAQPVVLFAVTRYADRDLEPDIKALQEAHPALKHIVPLGESFETAIAKDRSHLDSALAERAKAVAPDDDVLLLYTSGSTGKPKGVVLTHDNIIANIAVETRCFRITHEARGLMHFPINHVAACVEIGFALIMAGGTTVMLERFDPLESLSTVERERITLFGQVPTMFLMQMGLSRFRTLDWSSVQTIVWSGSSAPHLIINGLAAIAEKTGAMLCTGYGSTEASGFVTYTKFGEPIETMFSTAGQVQPEFEARIVDANRKPLPAGEIGEFAIRGPIVFNRYLNNPEATSAVKDADGWFYTGDMGRIDENAYLTLTGRKSEMYKTGGENIYPREIEEVIEDMPAVLMAAVIGVPHRVYQEVGRAFVMPKPGMTVTVEEITQVCQTHLANFKIPREIEIHPILPMLANGKIDKVTLKEKYLAEHKQ